MIRLGEKSQAEIAELFKGSLDCFPDDERGSGERVTESSALNR